MLWYVNFCFNIFQNQNKFGKWGIIITNIAFLNNSGPGDYGGVEKWIFKMAKGLKNKGYNSFVLARKDSLLLEKVKKERMNYKVIDKIGSTTFLNPIRIFKLADWLKKKNINAIFFCSSPTFKYGSITAKLADVSNIIYRRGSAIPIKNKFYNRYLMNNFITTFISNSKATKEKSLKYLESFPDKKVKLIYNGVDKSKFTNIDLKSNIRKEFKIDEEDLLMVNVGRLHKQKGHKYLIESISKLKNRFDNFTVLIIGEGPLENKLKDRVDELNLNDYIIFTGFRKDIPSLLKQSDFMVHTALWEGCPWVVLEALMSGLPVVATNSSSLPEIIREGENGYLAKDKDIENIADKIFKMINNSNIEKMGNKARKIAENEFSFKRVIAETEKCIKE